MNAKLELQKVLRFCQEILDDERSFENDFLIDLKNGSMTFEQFVLTQKQFFFAVSFFSRPMTALMSRFADPLVRIKILENVLEEHGGMNQACFHESTFKEFLNSLGVEVTNSKP